MEFTFDEKAKNALNELIENSSEEYVRIKVFYGCGRPAYDLYPDFKSDEDEEVIISGIKFVVNKKMLELVISLKLNMIKKYLIKDFIYVI